MTPGRPAAGEATHSGLVAWRAARTAAATPDRCLGAIPPRAARSPLDDGLLIDAGTTSAPPPDRCPECGKVRTDSVMPRVTIQLEAGDAPFAVVVGPCGVVRGKMYVAVYESGSTFQFVRGGVVEFRMPEDLAIPALSGQPPGEA